MRGRFLLSSILSLCLIISALACEKSHSPTEPLQQPKSQSGVVWGYITGSGGACLVGAVVEVVDGPRAGEKVEQKDCPYDDGAGYMLSDLVPGAKVTLRVSATGYKSAQQAVLAGAGWADQTNFVLVKE